MDKLKKHTMVKGRAPDAHLYSPDKKDKKPTDKDLFVMNQRDSKKKSK